MTYIYDIVLNFHKNYYNFYEWNKTDKIKNIYKIPLYRISDIDIINIINNKIKLNNSTLEKFKDIYKFNKKIIILVSNTKITIGLLIDEKGNILKKSSLIFEEETEANNIAKTLMITKLDYKKIKELKHHSILRIELEKKNLFIKYIIELQDETTLKYLYYEYFNKECNNKEIIKNSLLKELEKDWNIKKTNLYKTINLLIKLPSK